jgi:hypothetical protein
MAQADHDELREQTLDRLTEAYAADVLTTSDYERRVERVTRAESDAEVRSAVADLPAPYGHRRRTKPEAGAGEDDAGVAGSEDTTLAVFSSRTLRPSGERGGPERSVSVLGELTIDLRELPPESPAIPVNVVSVLGEVKILLPPGARLDNRMVTLLADVNEKRTRPSRVARGFGRGARAGSRDGPGSGYAAGPTIRLEGFCLMSDVKIVVEAD